MSVLHASLSVPRTRAHYVIELLQLNRRQKRTSKSIEQHDGIEVKKKSKLQIMPKKETIRLFCLENLCI